MSLVVTGLSQNSDISALHKNLQAAGLDTGPLEVISPDDAPSRRSGGLAGSELLTGDRGTAVPGINNARSRAYFNDETLADRIGDLEIPDSEIENYLEALERGRSLVAYYAQPATVDRVEEAFRAAQLLNVRRF